MKMMALAGAVAAMATAGCGIALVPPTTTPTAHATPSASPPQSATPAPVAAGGGHVTTSAYSFSYPAGWSLQPLSQSPASGYGISSGGALDQFGIPPAGDVGITVISGPFPSALSPQSATLQQVLDSAVGYPKAATGVQSGSYQNLTLGGSPALGVVVTYTYNGIPNLQEDVLTTHGSVVYIVELDTEPSLQLSAESDLSQVLDSWSWTGGA